jgi:LL-diaminopimelate aminotransferase
MAGINDNYRNLQKNYLFIEIGRRTREFQAANPDADVMRLGIGDTVLPLGPTVVAGLHDAVDRLSKQETYTGYGNGEGNEELREALVKRYGERGVELGTDEVFVSDGAKTDSANILSLFEPENNIMAVQDPSYPVYVDAGVISGFSGEYDRETGQYDEYVYMPCTAENSFIPEIPNCETDIIYFCSPNNPTGAAATMEQLKGFVDYAREKKALIVFDAAYAPFITDPNIPRSIYEVEGAKDCAVEINSFSKECGFTGVRLGSTVVPKTLSVTQQYNYDSHKFEDIEPDTLNGMWLRRQNTFFNGASNIPQAGGLAALSPEGQKWSADQIAYYMKNARTIKEGVESIGLTAYGGDNAPYIWMQTPELETSERMPSWDFFDKFLSETGVVGTPGVGFGPSGEGYFRLSAFGIKDDVERAVDSIQKNLKL